MAIKSIPFNLFKERLLKKLFDVSVSDSEFLKIWLTLNDNSMELPMNVHTNNPDVPLIKMPAANIAPLHEFRRLLRHQVINTNLALNNSLGVFTNIVGNIRYMPMYVGGDASYAIYVTGMFLESDSFEESYMCMLDKEKLEIIEAVLTKKNLVN